MIVTTLQPISTFSTTLSKADSPSLSVVAEQVLTTELRVVDQSGVVTELGILATSLSIVRAESATQTTVGALSTTLAGQSFSLVTNIQAAVVLPGGVSFTTEQYEHTQSIAQSTWVVNHALGKKVNARAYTVGGVEMLCSTRQINNNQVQLDFDEPTAGFAVCS